MAYTRFTVEIEMGNNAMRTRHDAALALDHVANKLRYGSLCYGGKVTDENSNVVGHWELEHDGKAESFSVKSNSDKWEQWCEHERENMLSDEHLPLR